MKMELGFQGGMDGLRNSYAKVAEMADDRNRLELRISFCNRIMESKARSWKDTCVAVVLKPKEMLI